MLLSAVKEYIQIPTQSAHVSCLARFRGRLFVTFFGGTKEGAPDVGIYVARRADGGWEPARRVAEWPDGPCWNPVLLPREDGLDLFYKVSAPIGEWFTLRLSLDENLNVVREPAELCPGDIGGRGPVKNKCLRLKNGLLAAPSSTETDGWEVFIDLSEDGGETFPIHAHVPRCPEAKGLGAIQPALWETRDGRVHLLARSTEGCLMRADSDDGIAWSPLRPTDIPNNNSGIDLARLDDGKIVLALNPVSGNWAARTPLWLYVSRDDGGTFSPWMALETAPGEYSYPCVLAEGRTLHVSYTHRRERIAHWTIELEEETP